MSDKPDYMSCKYRTCHECAYKLSNSTWIDFNKAFCLSIHRPTLGFCTKSSRRLCCKHSLLAWCTYRITWTKRFSSVTHDSHISRCLWEACLLKMTGISNRRLAWSYLPRGFHAITIFHPWMHTVGDKAWLLDASVVPHSSRSSSALLLLLLCPTALRSKTRAARLPISWHVHVHSMLSFVQHTVYKYIHIHAHTYLINMQLYWLWHRIFTVSRFNSEWSERPMIRQKMFSIPYLRHASELYIHGEIQPAVFKQHIHAIIEDFPS